MQSEIGATDGLGWTKVGGQAGSNAGGLYQDRDGVRWYLKIPARDGQARNEVLANHLYRLAGGGARGQAGGAGRPARGRRIVKGLTLADLSGDSAARHSAALCKHFAADAWLANRDVLGADLDNIVVDHRGGVIRIDLGGALRYRAQGADKADFGDSAIEFGSLRDPARNAVAARIFGSMSAPQLQASVRLVAAISDAAIRAAVLGIEGEGRGVQDP
ncbi:MAG: type III effector HopAG1 [Rhodopseudomonas palustris]|nr:type III effector HopAG1 [Rhodopseudomonas palustris]